MVSNEIMQHWSRQAELYATSKAHGNPVALAAIVEQTEPNPDDIVLDVATGTAHTALAFAPFVRTVCATDQAIGMMEAGRNLAKQRGIENLYLHLARSEDLPFRDGTFDLVTCRLAAHHFQDFDKAIGEFARVTKPGGKVFFMDTVAPEAKDLSDFVNEVEIRRDPTHVASLSPFTIHSMFVKHGLNVVEVALSKSGGQDRAAFDGWVERSATPRDQIEYILEMFRTASPRVAEAFKIRTNGDELFYNFGSIRVIATKPRY